MPPIREPGDGIGDVPMDPNGGAATLGMGPSVMQEVLGDGQGVSAGDGIVQTYTRGEDKGWSETVTFSRPFIHFLGPGTEFAGAMLESNEDNELCYYYDFGGSFLPYCISRAGITPYHLYKYMMRCNSYRILEHKAVCHDLITSRDEIQPDGRIVTTPQRDTIEVFTDKNHKFLPNNILPVESSTLFGINMGFRRVEPMTYEEGLLPRAKIVLPSEVTASTRWEENYQYKLSAFDVYNGLFTVSHWQPGTPFEVSHKCDSGRLPVGLFNKSTKLACNQQRLQTCKKLLDTVWGIQANMATQVNKSPIQPPATVFFRFAPYWTASGRAIRRAQFKCTYSTTIEFYYSPDVGINLFMMGNQGDRINWPFSDAFDAASADPEILNWCVRPEEFVIPMTGYQFSETMASGSEIPQPRDITRAKLDGAHEDDLPLLNRVLTKMQKRGFNVSTQTVGNVNVGIKVEDIGIQTEEQVGPAPQFNADVMEMEGWTAEDQEAMFKFAEQIEAVNKEKPDKYHTMTTGPKAGLITNKDNGEPITPVVVNPRVDGQLEVTNPRFYRPAD